MYVVTMTLVAERLAHLPPVLTSILKYCGMGLLVPLSIGSIVCECDWDIRVLASLVGQGQIKYNIAHVALIYLILEVKYGFQ